MEIRKFNLPEEQKVIKYLSSISYPGYYKNNKGKCWPIDQKCTYDVLYTDCKCILNMANVNKKYTFSAKDFLEDAYSKTLYSTKTSKNGKASISSGTKKEYDKIFWNIFELLSYTEILEKDICTKKFTIIKIEMIEILASSEEACVAFICHIVYNLIVSVGLKQSWDNVIANPSQINIENFRNDYQKWMLDTTNHKKDLGQIFQKFINPLFYLFQLKKYHPIHCPKDLPQSLHDLSYFRQHIRDSRKTFGMTRAEHKSIVDMPISSFTNIILHENAQKADVKKWNQEFYGLTNNEFFSELSETKIITGIQVHHIWPKMEFDATSPFSPNIYENMIILDQKQHLGYAHSSGSTIKINKNNLNFILWKQFEKIEKFSKKGIGHYDPQKFYVLVCLIKSIIPMKVESKEILIGYIEDAISL